MKSLFVLLACVTLISWGCGDRKTAQEAFDAGDYVTAYKLFKPRAEAGDVEAQNYLGVHYYLGLGVKRDLHKALQWYEKAALQGDPGCAAQLRIDVSTTVTARNPDMGYGFHVVLRFLPPGQSDCRALHEFIGG